MTLARIHRELKEKASIYIVYIREAHPDDGWKVPQNERDGIKLDDPKTWEERAKAAGACLKDLKLEIPCVVDGMDDAARKAFAGWPDRLYVLDAARKVAYRGEPGPRGFRPEEAETALKKLLAP